MVHLAYPLPSTPCVLRQSVNNLRLSLPFNLLAIYSSDLPIFLEFEILRSIANIGSASSANLFVTLQYNSNTERTLRAIKYSKQDTDSL